MQPGFHRADGHAQYLRDLLIGEILNIVEDEDGSELVRHLGEGALNVNGFG